MSAIKATPRRKRQYAFYDLASNAITTGKSCATELGFLDMRCGTSRRWTSFVGGNLFDAAGFLLRERILGSSN